MNNKIVEWNPSDWDQFATSSQGSSKIDILSISRGENSLTTLKSLDSQAPSIPSLGWHPCDAFDAYIAYGGANGLVGVWNHMSSSELIVYNSSLSRRACTSLAWSKEQPNLLAGGFEKSRSSSEFCAVVWDLNAVSAPQAGNAGACDSGIIFKPNIEEPISALCWTSSAHEVLLGTSMGMVRLHDTRMSDSVCSVSLSAHLANRPRKVKGLRLDPLNPHLLCTFSDFPSEPVKMWDLRKGSNSKPRLTINPFAKGRGDTSAAQTSFVTEAQFCHHRWNAIAISTSSQKYVSVYCTQKPASVEAVTRSPLYSINSTEPVRGLRWRHPGLSSHSSTASLSNLQLLLNGSIEEVRVADSSGVSINATGEVVSCFGRSILYSRPTVAATALRLDYADMSAVMQLRSKAGYSVNAGKNVQVLSDEYDRLVAKLEGCDGDDEEFLLIMNRLLVLMRAWGWIHRVDELISSGELDCSLQACGVFQLLNSSERTASTCILHSQLGLEVFDSDLRSQSRLVCGWCDKMLIPGLHTEIESEGDETDREKMNRIIEDVEATECFERACAMYVWHGNLASSVDLIQRIVRKFSSGPTDRGAYSDDELIVEESLQLEYVDMTPEYISLLNLVSMCIAGFSGGSIGSKADLWATMCKHVLNELSRSTCSRYGRHYLSAVCQFLLMSTSEESISTADRRWGRFSSVVEDTHISLEDRIAFGCNFLSDTLLLSWLSDLQGRLVDGGNLEGLVVTGFSAVGCDLLQHHLDQCDDLQTVALMVSRLVDKSTQTPKIESKESIWLSLYRSLLNQWQLFVERASLDVELGRYYRVKQNQSQVMQKSMLSSQSKLAVKASSSSVAGPTERKGSASRSFHVLPPQNSLFPHLHLRCNFCNSSLPADPMPTQQQAFLRKQCPVINCCPHCKKQMPRCYICSLYLGFVNPTAEMSRMFRQKRLSSEMALSGQPQGPSSTAELDKFEGSNVLGFGKWFFFCQKCRHGGHASCVGAWFGEQGDICGVSDCNCRCQTL